MRPARPQQSIPSHKRSIVIGAILTVAILGIMTSPHTAHAMEPFDGSCEWEFDRGQPAPIVIGGFRTDSAVVPTEQEQEIIEFAKQSSHYSKICVVGHADKRGSYSDNDRLAMKRARAVAARLIGAGLEPDILSLSSRAEVFGDAFPNWFWANGNRRVEIIAME